ncbi:hypothetical protein PsYK624_089200 [Phanerochaete sordida]|uniref:Uncharacterized protein n=1 Tax=Phanerochaete sordida TaxID=48140 RepID=A0A9P3GFH5_9APHY|nr:hypothetical protein PsYK624_089200 [Phanerochaete sordida]
MAAVHRFASRYARTAANRPRDVQESPRAREQPCSGRRHVAPPRARGDCTLAAMLMSRCEGRADRRRPAAISLGLDAVVKQSLGVRAQAVCRLGTQGTAVAVLSVFCADAHPGRARSRHGRCRHPQTAFPMISPAAGHPRGAGRPGPSPAFSRIPRASWHGKADAPSNRVVRGTVPHAPRHERPQKPPRVPAVHRLRAVASTPRARRGVPEACFAVRCAAQDGGREMAPQIQGPGGTGTRRSYVVGGALPPSARCGHAAQPKTPKTLSISQVPADP